MTVYPQIPYYDAEKDVNCTYTQNKAFKRRQRVSKRDDRRSDVEKGSYSVKTQVKLVSHADKLNATDKEKNINDFISSLAIVEDGQDTIRCAITNSNRYGLSLIGPLPRSVVRAGQRYI